MSGNNSITVSIYGNSDFTERAVPIFTGADDLAIFIENNRPAIDDRITVQPEILFYSRLTERRGM